MDSNEVHSIEEIKKILDGMEISYEDKQAEPNQLSIINTFGYVAFPIIVDLGNVENVDAEKGTVVRNVDKTVDDGIYIFTILRSGQAAFIVVIPGTISHAPMIRKVSGDIISAINGLDLPPMMAYDMVEVMARVLSSTFMRIITDACNIPAEYREAFLRIYMPKFLANVGMYFVGATDEDGKPLIYEEIVNMEPMIVWNALQKKNGLMPQDPKQQESEKTEDLASQYPKQQELEKTEDVKSE